MDESGVRLPIGPHFDQFSVNNAMLKKIFIPGWMDTADSRVDFDGLEIWKKKINPNDKIRAEYVIGHSLGANFALINWNYHKNTKLILINPLVPKRSILSWLICWVKFLFSEGTSINRKRLGCFPHVFSGIMKCLELISIDTMKILLSIPVENMWIIRGKNDKHFFIKEISGIIKKRGIKVIEVENAGHGWSEKFNEEISKLIK